jgi:hypothetical protein
MGTVTMRSQEVSFRQTSRTGREPGHVIAVSMDTGSFFEEYSYRLAKVLDYAGINRWQPVASLPQFNIN